MHAGQQRRRRRGAVPGGGDQPRVDAGEFHQGAFRATQHQGQPVAVGGPEQRGHAQRPQLIVEPAHPVAAQHAHRRHVQGAGQRLVGGHRAAVLAVEVFRAVAAVIGGQVGHQGARQQLPGVQHRAVQQRLEHAAGGARPGGDVHGGAVGERVAVIDVAQVGAHRHRPVVDHHHRQVVHALAPQPLAVVVGEVAHPALQVRVQGGAQQRRAVAGGERIQQPGRQRRQRLDPGQRLETGQGQVVPVQGALLPQRFQQTVALGAQPFPVAPGMNQRRAVGQHRQQRRFRPAELLRRPLKIAPGGGAQAHGVAAERRAAGVLAQDLVLIQVPLQLQRQHRFAGFFREGARRVGAQQAGQLHGQGGAAADHPTGGQIVAGGAQHRQRVHAGVGFEAAVLEGEQRPAILVRHPRHRGEAPLLVGGDARRQRPSLPVQHQGGVVAGRERGGQRRELQKRQPGQQRQGGAGQGPPPAAACKTPLNRGSPPPTGLYCGRGCRPGTWPPPASPADRNARRRWRSAPGCIPAPRRRPARSN